MIEISEILTAEAHLEGLEAVVFDLDDTLYPERAYVRSGYRILGRHYPQIPDMEQKLWEVFLRGGRAIDEVLEREGITDPAVKENCLQLYRWQKPEISLYPGVAQLLQRLRTKGLKLGIITDGRPEGQQAKLEALGLEAYVDAVIITDTLGGIAYRKPNPASYLEMARRLETPLAKMAYIGDNSAKDFQAPEALGMRSIWFRNPEGLYNR